MGLYDAIKKTVKPQSTINLTINIKS